MPSGFVTMLMTDIEGSTALVQLPPDVHAWASALGDIQGGPMMRRNPTVPAEGQWRALDQSAQQAVAEIVVKPLEPIEVEGPLVDPHPLDELRLVSRP